MSYILEALKKAQAERQLGATPDVHAPTIDAYAARQSGRPAWLPAALGGAAAVAALGLALWWRQDTPAVVAPQAGMPVPATAGQADVPAGPVQAAQSGAGQPVPAQAPAAAQPIAAAAPPAAGQLAARAPAIQPPPAQASAAQPSATSAPAAQAPAAPPSAAPLPAPATAAAVPVPASAVAARQGADQPPMAGAAARGNTSPSVTRPEPRTAASGTPARPVPPAAQPAQQAVAAAPAKPAAAPEPQEEFIPAARDLPEPIQRILPTVAMSGYMYSKNPADRLVLIDKALRREGDEVAPGLVLERLQPKGAVFTFRGYRYRVPY